MFLPKVCGFLRFEDDELEDVLQSLRFGDFGTIICEDDRHARSATFYAFLDGCIDVEVLSSKPLPLREIEERPILHLALQPLIDATLPA